MDAVVDGRLLRQLVIGGRLLRDGAALARRREADDRRRAAAGRRGRAAEPSVGVHRLGGRAALLDMAVAVDAARHDDPAGRVPFALASAEAAGECPDPPPATPDTPF